MRPPERIDVFIKVLKRVWKKHPDIRLGQLIVDSMKTSEDPDLFYIEDWQLQERIENLEKRWETK